MSILSAYVVVADDTRTSVKSLGKAWQGHLIVEIFGAGYDTLQVYIADEHARALAGQIYAALLPSDDDTLARRLEWATGTNGEELLRHLRAEGLDVVTVTTEHAEGATA